MSPFPAFFAWAQPSGLNCGRQIVQVAVLIIGSYEPNCGVAYEHTNYRDRDAYWTAPYLGADAKLCHILARRARHMHNRCQCKQSQQ